MHKEIRRTQEATKRHAPVVEDDAETQSTMDIIQRHLYRLEQ